MPIAIASGCAPEQERGVLTRSPVLFQAPRPRSPPACSPSKTLVVFVPAQNNPRHRPPNPHERFVRDSQIPIGRARPTSPQPPRGFLLGRLSDAGPATRTTVLQGAGVRNPSPIEASKAEASYVRNASTPVVSDGEIFRHQRRCGLLGGSVAMDARHITGSSPTRPDADFIPAASRALYTLPRPMLSALAMSVTERPALKSFTASSALRRADGLRPM